MDKIILPNIPFTACHGCNPEERTTPQPFRASVTCWLSTQAAGCADDLTLTVDYGELYQRILAHVTEHSYFLIEALAEHVAELVLADRRICKTEVTVEKLAAKAGNVVFPAMVTIERGRNE